MISGPAFGLRFIRDDDRITRQQIKPGTVRRILPYFTRYRWTLVFLFFVTAVDSAITVATPAMFPWRPPCRRSWCLSARPCSPG